MKTRFLCASALSVMVLIAPALALTAQQRDAKLDHIADLIRDHYVYKDKALKIADSVRALKADPSIIAITDEGQLATLLSEKLTPYDRHFHVTWRAPSPSQQQAAAAPDLAAEEAFMRQVNYGFDEVKRLPGNIGYLRFSFFADFDTALTGKKTPEARKTAEAALAFMANCDAVIFDLRQNGGGSPAMIDLLLSPFFKDKVLLNRFYQREGDRTEEFYTLTNYTGPKRSDVPLFVLISGRTASAAEEFAYDVQTQKRGTLIGDVTYGGANPGDFVDAGDGFAIFISTGAAINPITGTNWEAVGVKPDIAVPQDQAMSRANIEALKAILAKPAAGRDYTAQRWALEQEEALLHPPKPQALEPFAGQYMARSVELKDGALYFVRDRAPQVKLVPLGPDLFGGEGVPDRRFQFARDAQGKVERLTVRDASGGSTVFTRTTP